MPHIIVKLYSGKSEEQKNQLAGAIVRDVVAITGCREAAVSVAMEDVDADDWVEKVYKPDILDKKETLYVKPGYDPLGPST